MTTEAQTAPAAGADAKQVEITVKDQLRGTAHVYYVSQDATVMDLKETICKGNDTTKAGPAPQQMTLYQLRSVEGQEKQEIFIPKHTDKLGTTFCQGSPDEHFMVFILLHKYFA